jgi:hypothetical protein
MALNHLSEWCGRAHVRYQSQTSEAAEGLKGAYGWILALAHSEAHFRERVRAELEALGQTVVELEEVDRFDPGAGIGTELEELARALSPEWPIQYRTFHAYRAEDC